MWAGPAESDFRRMLRQRTETKPPHLNEMFRNVSFTGAQTFEINTRKQRRDTNLCLNVAVQCSAVHA